MNRIMATQDLHRRFELARWLGDSSLDQLKPVPRSIAIFGSFAGGILTPVSDIDLLLIGDQIPKKPFDRAKWFNPLRKAFVDHRDQSFPDLPEILSSVTMTEKSWIDAIGLQLSVCQNAWILRDDGFLSHSLAEASRSIARGDWTREDVSTGGWFWVPRGQTA
jgi:predicted nucleotidyltransferase